MRDKNSNSLFSNSLLIFLARFSPQLAVLLVIIFFSRKLDVQAYGSYQNFWARLYLLNTIACLGIPAFFMTYKPAFIAGIMQRLRSLHYVYYIGWVLVVSSIFAWLQYQDGVLPFYLPLLFLFTYSASLVGESLSIIRKKYTVLISVNVLYAVLFCVVHYLFLQQAIDYLQLFFYLLLLSVFRLLAYLPGIIHFINTTEKETVTDLNDVRSLWMHLGFYDVSQMFFKWIDKFIISLMVTAGMFALYFNGTIDIPFISLLLGAVGSAALMQLAHIHEKENLHYIHIAHYTSRLLSCVVFPLFCLLFFFRQELFDVVFLSKYNAAVPIFMVSVCALPLYSYNLTTVLQNHHKGRIINTGAVLDLFIALALMYPLYKLAGLPGVALSFVLSSYIQAIYYLHHTSRLLQTSIASLLPWRNWLLKAIVFFLLFIAFHYYLQANYNAQIVLICGIVLAFISIAITLFIELKVLKQEYGHATQA